VLRLKVLDLLLAFFPVHSNFLGFGESESSNKHCALKSEGPVAKPRLYQACFAESHHASGPPVIEL
jgi:hypothetical protein